jgi:hypothetical protein
VAAAAPVDAMRAIRRAGRIKLSLRSFVTLARRLLCHRMAGREARVTSPQVFFQMEDEDRFVAGLFSFRNSTACTRPP